MVEEKTRDFSVDIIRGLAMILIVVGHTFTPGSLPRNIIFTFHIPLMFFISGCFFTTRKGKIKKVFVRTAKPYIFTAGVIIILGTVKSAIKAGCFEITFFTEQLLSALYMSGSETEFLKWTIPAIGAIWYLPALLWATVFLYYILKLPRGGNGLQLQFCLLRDGCPQKLYGFHFQSRQERVRCSSYIWDMSGIST